MPFRDLAIKSTDNAKIRKLIENMIYVGVVGELLNIDVAEIDKAIRKMFSGKPKAADSNVLAAANGRE